MQVVSPFRTIKKIAAGFVKILLFSRVNNPLESTEALKTFLWWNIKKQLKKKKNKGYFYSLVYTQPYWTKTDFDSNMNLNILFKIIVMDVY